MSGFRISDALGPCSAICAQPAEASVTSVSNPFARSRIQAKSLAVFAALTTTK